MKNKNLIGKFYFVQDSDPDNFETSPVLKELNGRMPGQEQCEPSGTNTPGLVLGRLISFQKFIFVLVAQMTEFVM